MQLIFLFWSFFQLCDIGFYYYYFLICIFLWVFHVVNSIIWKWQKFASSLPNLVPFHPVLVHWLGSATAVAQVRSVAQELLHAAGMAKKNHKKTKTKKRKKRKRKRNASNILQLNNDVCYRVLEDFLQIKKVQTQNFHFRVFIQRVKEQFKKIYALYTTIVALFTTDKIWKQPMSTDG